MFPPTFWEETFHLNSLRRKGRRPARPWAARFPSALCPLVAAFAWSSEFRASRQYCEACITGTLLGKKLKNTHIQRLLCHPALPYFCIWNVRPHPFRRPIATLSGLGWVPPSPGGQVGCPPYTPVALGQISCLQSTCRVSMGMCLCFPRSPLFPHVLVGILPWLFPPEVCCTVELLYRCVHTCKGRG